MGRPRPRFDTPALLVLHAQPVPKGSKLGVANLAETNLAETNLAETNFHHSAATHPKNSKEQSAHFFPRPRGTAAPIHRALLTPQPRALKSLGAASLASRSRAPRLSPSPLSMIVLALEGCHGSGKTELSTLFAAKGYTVLDEGFLDMPSHLLHPQSIVMELAW